MLQASFSEVSKDFGGNPILREIDLEIIEGERIGLVGENGGGKSTLFRLLAGRETPTTGTIPRKRNLTIGHLTPEGNPAQTHQTTFQRRFPAPPDTWPLPAPLH